MTGSAGPPGGPGRGKGGERAYYRYLHLGTQMAVILALGVLGGWWLDGRLGTEPAFTVTGTLAGILLGIGVVILEVGKERR